MSKDARFYYGNSGSITIDLNRVAHFSKEMMTELCKVFNWLYNVQVSNVSKNLIGCELQIVTCSI